MCCGCRQQNHKSDMARLYMGPDSHLMIDETGKAGGRGVYVCRNEACLSRAQKTGAISRGLKQNVPAEEIREIMQMIIKPV